MLNRFKRTVVRNHVAQAPDSLRIRDLLEYPQLQSAMIDTPPTAVRVDRLDVVPTRWRRRHIGRATRHRAARREPRPVERKHVDVTKADAPSAAHRDRPPTRHDRAILTRTPTSTHPDGTA